jgi:outer membrane protein assembly factor BamB
MAVRSRSLAGAPGAYLGGAQNGVVFAGSGSGRVYAIDVLSGTARWSTSIVDRRADDGVRADSGRRAAVRDVYSKQGATSGGVIALNAATGVEQWRTIFPVTRRSCGHFCEQRRDRQSSRLRKPRDCR